MAKEDLIEMDGDVVAVSGSGFFTVDIGGQTCVCRVAGKLNSNKIKIVLGDKVKVEMSPYDSTKGRISWRYDKKKESQEST